MVLGEIPGFFWGPDTSGLLGTATKVIKSISDIHGVLRNHSCDKGWLLLRGWTRWHDPFSTGWWKHWWHQLLAHFFCCGISKEYLDIYIFSMTSLVGSSSNRKEPRIDHPKRPIWESTLCEGPNDLWLEDCSSTPRGLKKRAEYNLLVQPWQGKLRSNANSSFTSVGHHWYPPKAPATNPIKSWCHRSTNHLQDWVNQVKSEVLTYCVAGIYGL